MKSLPKYILAAILALPALAAGVLLSIVYIPRLQFERFSMGIESSLSSVWTPYFILIQYGILSVLILCLCLIFFELFTKHEKKHKIRFMILCSLLGTIYISTLGLSINVISSFDDLRKKQYIQMKYYELHLLEIGESEPIIEIAGEAYFQEKNQAHLEQKAEAQPVE